MQGSVPAKQTSGYKLAEKYCCSFCKSLMTEPVQTNCGHLYCRACLGRLKQGKTGQSWCLVDNEIITEVFPDNFVKREIMEHIKGSGQATKEDQPLVPADSPGLVPRNVNSMNGLGNVSFEAEGECVPGTTSGGCVRSADEVADLTNKNRELELRVEQMEQQLLETRQRAGRQQIPVHGYGDGEEAYCPFKTWGCHHLQPMPRPVLQAHLQEETASHIELMRVEITQHVATREEVEWSAAETKGAIAQQFAGLEHALEAPIASTRRELERLKREHERAVRQIRNLERDVEAQEHLLAAQNRARAEMRADGGDDEDEGFADDWWMWCGP